MRSKRFGGKRGQKHVDGIPLASGRTATSHGSNTSARASPAIVVTSAKENDQNRKFVPKLSHIGNRKKLLTRNNSASPCTPSLAPIFASLQEPRQIGKRGLLAKVFSVLNYHTLKHIALLGFAYETCELLLIGCR